MLIFLQAEDGMRDIGVTGVQTCALPIWPRLSPGQEAIVAEWAEQGPDLARDGVVRWRCRDLRHRIAREFAVGLHERTVGKLLARLGFRRVSVRPQHPQSNPEAQAGFRAGSPVW